jgi:hypothetical protein
LLQIAIQNAAPLFISFACPGRFRLLILYLVEKLHGMNLYTGVNGITQDLDVKHDLNREYFSLNYV